MASIFTRIIAREIPAQIVAENDDFLAFMDINPLTDGHCLAIPKKEVDYIYDLDDHTLTGLHLFAKKVALGIQKVVPCERIGITIMGLEVPHAHVHLIPMNTIDDMNFSRLKLNPTRDELSALANKIRLSIVL